MRSARGMTGLLLALALAGAAAMDRLGPPALPSGASDPTPSAGRVLGCPFAKSAGASGFLHLANVARDRASIRVRFIPDGATPVFQEVALEGAHATTLQVPPEIRGAAGAIVSSAGGEVFASTSGFVVPIQGRSGAVAAPCGRAGPAVQVVPQGATLGADTVVLILNPAASDAVVDVSFLVGGNEVQPESLRRRIVPAFSRLVVREGDFVFDEVSVAAVVRSSAGRVITAGLTTSARVVELAPGAAPALEVAAVGSALRGPLAFASVDAGEEDAVVEARTLSPSGASSFEALAAGLPARTPRVDAVPPASVAGAAAVGFAARSTNAPIVVGARWEVSPARGAPETAFASGVAPAHRVVSVLGPPAQPGDVRVLVANPGSSAAAVSLALFTASGPLANVPPEVRSFTIAPGTAAGILLQNLPVPLTLAAVLTSGGARIVAALEATASGPEGFGAFAVTAASGDSPAPVSVEQDPRLGVPAG